MSGRRKEKRIGGNALESIMRDVLDGMQGFTRESVVDSDPADMQIIGVERPERCGKHRATVIPFPGTGNARGRKRR